MSDLLDKLHPYGWTDRRSYAILVAAYAVAALTLIVLVKAFFAPVVAIIPIYAALSVVLLLFTIRRLRDAGHSIWLAALFFFPVSIVFELATVRWGPVSIELINVTDLLRWVPVLIGLLAPSIPEEQRLA
jgi:uncharacterized membrane protein YhaH (DUF805 family)